jgi:magnesium-transporting ATPase (P-type)
VFAGVQVIFGMWLVFHGTLGTTTTTTTTYISKTRDSNGSINSSIPLVQAMNGIDNNKTVFFIMFSFISTVLTASICNSNALQDRLIFSFEKNKQSIYCSVCSILASLISDICILRCFNLLSDTFLL